MVVIILNSRWNKKYESLPHKREAAIKIRAIDTDNSSFNIE